jgi:hypothetical protein
MIHYDLRCGAGHVFDSWFKDSAAFERLAAAGQISCATCGSTDVSRALMAPAIAKGGRRVVQDSAPSTQQAPQRGNQPAESQSPEGVERRAVALAENHIPDRVRAMLQRMRAEVESRCDYVGPEFADEARKMHRGESERHGIFGETTQDEAEALRDEGIEFSSIPWLPRADG